ncbi:LysM peptidoglycan-binding domain-containing protein [Oharaeibacter diazotrophicus]|uniref:Nucleoid-associated protein YgaU n=2 Tax=Oharaeibacter diazotrophicus TaxID=1920512 RepID=A0A4R6RLS6_9HYPH|nr:LysM peptidoglycan-binding domain-containing protein [Oharaeibacter diazotrophicus]TDP87462.1 nucleoid-associated protein YgaU [Oharaeibacter diazotrophicus]BBE70594.1 LysM domain/BON superfamily protein [Pleomorphomonas sp. SM30]
MTKHIGNALAAAVAVVIAVLVALFGGFLDGVLRQIGVEIAGHPAPLPEGASTVVAVAPPVETKPSSKLAESAAAAARVVPIFDLVRVEPSGDAVIAGQGAPKARVEILSGGVAVASGAVNDTGEWAIVLADPLKPGAHDLSVRVTGPDGKPVTSEQSVAVSVPEGGKGEVLVVLNQPGSPSTVLQIPGEDETRKTLDAAGVAVPGGSVASAEGEAPAEKPADAAPAAGGSTAVVASAEPAPAPAEGGSTEVVAGTAGAGVSTTVTAEAPAGGSVAEGGLTTAPSAEPAPAPAPTPSAGQAVSSAPGSTAEGTITPAADAPAPAVSDPTPATPTATAGQGAAPASDSAGQGATTAPAIPAAPAEPAQTPSAQPAAPTPSAEPAAPTPSAEAPAVPAQAEPATPSAPAPAATPAPAAAPAEQPAPAPAAVAAPVRIDAVEVEDGRRLFAAGSAEPGATLRVYVDDALVADTKAMPTGRWLLEATRPLEAGRHVARVDHLGADGKVASRAEVPFELAAEAPADAGTASGTGTGQVAAGSGTTVVAPESGPQSLIIRRGDNLWTIARRLYGRGVRYSTIYQANTDQIRDPDLIYPGQIFVIPQGDTNWTPALPGAAPEPPPAAPVAPTTAPDGATAPAATSVTPAAPAN